MKVFWLDGGLKINPEGEKDVQRLTTLEAAVRAFDGMVITELEKGDQHSSPELVQTAVGSASKFL